MHLAYRELAPPNLCALGQCRAPCKAVPHPEHMWVKQCLLVHPSLRCHFVHRRWLVALAMSCLLTRLAKVSYFPSQVLSLSHSVTGTVCGSMPRHTAHGCKGSSDGLAGEALGRKEWERLCAHSSGDVGDGGRFKNEDCLLWVFEWEWVGMVPDDWSEAIMAESLSIACWCNCACWGAWSCGV